MKRALEILVLIAVLTAGLTAQKSKGKKATTDGARLETLLTELAGMDKEAWQRRLDDLDQAAKKAAAAAASLDKEARVLAAKAKAARAEMERLHAERIRLEELRKLIAAGVTKVESASSQKSPAKKASTEAVAKATESNRKAPTKKAPSKTAAAKAPIKKTPTKKTAADTKSAATKAAPAKAGKAAPPQAVVAYVTWKSHIADLMDEHCSVCHDPSDSSGGLDVTSIGAIRRGGASGRTLEPGNPDSSRLYLLTAHKEKPVMPKGADKLPKDQIDLIRRWIEQGAPETEAEGQAFAKKRAAEAAAEKANAAKATSTEIYPTEAPTVAVARGTRPEPIRALAVSPTTPLIAVPGKQQVLLLDANLGLRAVLPCALESIQAVTFSADGSLVAAAGGTPGRRGKAMVWRVRDGKALGTFGRIRDVALAVAVHHDPPRVAVGGPDRKVSVFDLDGKLRFKADKHGDWVLGAAFSPDGSRLATADRKGRVWLWDALSGHDLHEFKGHKSAVHAVAFRPNGKHLATAGEDISVRLWDVASGKQRWSKSAHRGGTLTVSCGPEAIVSGGADGRIRLWSYEGQGKTAPRGTGDWVYSSGLIGETLALYGDWQGRVVRYDRKTKKVAAILVPAPEDRVGTQRP